MGRSGGRSGGFRSGGGRAGGTRSSGRSASGGFSGSRGRSASRGFSSNTSRPPFGGGYMGPVFRPGRTYGGGLFGGGNVIINVDNHQENHTGTSTTQSEPVYTAPQEPMTTSQTSESPKKSRGISRIAIAIWTFLVIFILSMAGGGSDSEGITKSTVNRDKLHVKINDEAGYYTDECDWIRNRTVLENGLESFYDSTGIMPYLYIIDNVNGDYDPSTEKLEAFAEAKYEELFTDEGHALLLFWDYGGAYEYVLMLGYDTQKFMDTEACDILFDYLDYYYYYADTEEEFFADAFAEAGKRMMTVSRSPVYYIMIAAAVGIAVFGVCKVYKSLKDKEAERKKRAEEILNSPLEKFGESGDIIDELEKKYEKEI